MLKFAFRTDSRERTAKKDRADDLLEVVVNGNEMLPIYRDGDVLLISVVAQAQQGDRFVAKTVDGNLLGGTLLNDSPERIVIAAFGALRKSHSLARGELQFVGRVKWASQ